MRIIFIAGLGEEGFIFDKLREGLPGEHIVLSLWELLPDQPDRKLNVQKLAALVAERYSISPADLVVGHSTGGWVALYIKGLCGCRIVQLASWTDGARVPVPVRNRSLIYFAAWTGLYMNRFMLGRAIARNYSGKPSEEVFRTVFLRLMHGPRANTINQLRLIFNPAPVAGAKPDLRLHALADKVVRTPREPFVEVPGDHFSLYTFPDAVRAPILQFIKEHYGEA